MNPHPDLPETWPVFRPLIIAHDVGRSRDRSTAVSGGGSPFQAGMVGISELAELPQGLYGSPRASALAEIDRRYYSNALIVADLSNDASYAEPLVQTFGSRVIGLQISRFGDGTNVERRPVDGTAMLVYTVGRNFLIESFQSHLHSRLVLIADGPMSRRAYAQLEGLQTEMRESGVVYTCLPGQHDDLGISCCMLNWAARHPHLPSWITNAQFSRYRPATRRIDAKTAWAATT
jgi:hypothetical protein